MAGEEQFAFVLVRTKAAGNIGAASRALMNMGFSDLRLVAPDASADRVASELAAHGREVLRQARSYADLGAALYDRTAAIGTTCRPGLYRSGARPLREAALEMAAVEPADRVAFVFGPEDHGLSNADLKYCHRLITIPTAPRYPSINLAQAVMLVAYEVAAATGLSGGGRGQPSAARRARMFVPAPVTGVEAMLARMEQALIAIGFLPADTPERIMLALRAMLGRAGLTLRELDILNGIAHQIGWFAHGGREIIARKRRTGAKIR